MTSTMIAARPLPRRATLACLVSSMVTTRPIERKVALLPTKTDNSLAMATSSDRRRFEHLTLPKPIPARFGSEKVFILDLSINGARVAHQHTQLATSSEMLSGTRYTRCPGRR